MIALEVAHDLVKFTIEDVRPGVRTGVPPVNCGKTVAQPRDGGAARIQAKG